MKLKTKMIIFLLSAIFCFTAAAGCGEARPEPLPEKPGPSQTKVLPAHWVESANVNVFRDAVRDETAAQKISIDIARNEREAAQIVLRGATNFEITGVAFSDLAAKGATTKIAKENLKANYVEYVYLGSNSPGSVDADLVKKGAGEYPDALSNEESIFVLKQSAQPIWVTLFTPSDTAAGDYTGTVTVKTSAGDITVGMDVTVYDTELPTAENGEYEIAFWNQLLGSGFSVSYPEYHGTESIALKYGHKRWSNEWWELIGNIADEMAENRLNALQIQTVQLLCDGGSTVNADGSYTLNWDLFDEYIQFFIDKGFVKRLNGYVMMAGANTNLLRRDANGVTTTGQIAYNSEEATRWFDAYLPALQAHLEEKGWLDMWFQNLKDEPKVADKAIYLHILGKARTLAPKLKVGDALDDVGFLELIKKGEIVTDVYVPLLDMHSAQNAFFSAADDTKTVYSYTCVAPQGLNLNRFIDKPVWQGRSIGWYNYATGADGYLHWGLMAWYRDIDEFANGDTATIYPDVKNNTIKSSIRMSAVRDGAEEYELLKMMETAEIERYLAAHPEDTDLTGLTLLSRQLSQLIASKATVYTRDIDLMRAVRHALLEAVTGNFDEAEALVANS